jgi:hypothetical protein
MNLSILIGLYGDYPELSLRAVNSVLDNAIDHSFHLYVGMNECCPKTIAAMRHLADEGKINALIESRRNLNKDPMMRLLIDLVDTRFLLWMDDDSHLLPGWQEAIGDFLATSGGAFDVAGHVFYSNRTDKYQEFCRLRPWYVGDDHWFDPDHANRVWFATGGLWLARTAFLRWHNFPDRCMVKKQDDLLLGDLISQQRGRLLHFPNSIMDCVRISDAGDHGRRGTGEGDDGWFYGNVRSGK